MSIAEMKVQVFEKLAVLNDEAALKEILDYLDKVKQGDDKKFNTDVFFKKASEQYGEVLKKLAE